jgi:hypothetical protein
MAKGDGVIFVILGIVAAIASCFFDMFVSYNLGTAIKVVFTNPSSYWSLIQAIPSSLNGTSWWFIFFVLAPVFLMLGILFSLIGLNSSTSSMIGAIILIICPLIMWIYEIVNVAFDFAYLQTGFFILVVGVLLIIIGATRNSSHHD